MPAPIDALSQARAFAPGLFIRGFTPPLSLSAYKLIAFDMDSTLINIESVDEIAEIAEVAMRGEIADYKDSLRRRVALLVSVPESALQKVYDERLQLNPGVAAFVRVSGGGAENAGQPLPALR